MPSSLHFIHLCLEPSSLRFHPFMFGTLILGLSSIYVWKLSSTWIHSPYLNPRKKLFSYVIVFVNNPFGPFWLRLMQGDNIVLPIGGPSWCHILWAKEATTTPTVSSVRAQSSPTKWCSIFYIPQGQVWLIEFLCPIEQKKIPWEKNKQTNTLLL
jgi:hypothetical protein